MRDFIRWVITRREHTKDAARERLQLALMRDRMDMSPDIMDALKTDMLAVMSRYLTVGDDFTADDHSVIHGPLEVGDRVRVGRGAVVFRALVGDDVQIGEGAIVAGPAGEGSLLEIPDGTLVPADAVVTSEKDVRALEG